LSLAVSLALNVSEICPYQPVTAHCVVKKPLNNPNPFISWQCSGQNRVEEERLVFCNTQDNLDLHCQFGTAYDVTGSCKCNDSVIMSNVTFFAPPSGDMTLNCSNGVYEKQVFVSMNGIEAPTLSFIELTGKNNIHDVEIMWNDNNIFSDIKYILSVSNSSSPTRKPVEYVTTMIRKSLTLYAGVQYNISITAERCGGNLTSDFSAELTLYFEETSGPADESGQVTVAVVVSVITVPLLVFGAILLVFCIYRRRQKLNERRLNEKGGEMSQV
jgi:hypothetical protein